MDHHQGSGIYYPHVLAWGGGVLPSIRAATQRLTCGLQTAHDAPHTGSGLQPRLVRLATLEQKCPDERELDRGKGPEVVVLCEQLVHQRETDSHREGMVALRRLGSPAEFTLLRPEPTCSYLHEYKDGPPMAAKQSSSLLAPSCPSRNRRRCSCPPGECILHAPELQPLTSRWRS